MNKIRKLLLRASLVLYKIIEQRRLTAVNSVTAKTVDNIIAVQM